MQLHLCKAILYFLALTVSIELSHQLPMSTAGALVHPGETEDNEEQRRKKLKFVSALNIYS